MIFFRSVDCLPFPGHNANTDQLITYYFSQMYSADEIIGFLLFIHGIRISKRTFYRLTKRLRLKKNCVERPVVEILRTIFYLHRQGYSNVGYKTMWRLLNTHYGIRATQETVRLALRILDPQGVASRVKRRLSRRKYSSKGPNFTIHIDGYDKLKPFGICIHGAIDGFSRRILWLEASPSNKNPRFVARYYMNYLKEIKRLPRVVRSDAGTENVIIRDIHTTLRSCHGDSMAGNKSFLTGRSTANQRVEQLWGTVSKNLTHFWRNLFKDLIDEGLLNNADPLHIECVRFCFLGLIQDRLDIFRQTWNSHRIRSQRNVDVSCGVPNVLFYQPILYDAADYLFPLPCNMATVEMISEVYSEPVPLRGCSEEFIRIVELVSDTDIENFPTFSSVENSIAMYRALIEYFNIV